MAKREVMKEKTDVELAKLLGESRETLRTERFSAAGARAKDSNAPRKLRRTIARILTEQSARTRTTSAAASVSSDSRPTTA